MAAGAGKLGKYAGAPIWEQGDWPKKVGDWEIQTPHRGLPLQDMYCTVHSTINCEYDKESQIVVISRLKIYIFECLKALQTRTINTSAISQHSKY